MYGPATTVFSYVVHSAFIIYHQKRKRASPFLFLLGVQALKGLIRNIKVRNRWDMKRAYIRHLWDFNETIEVEEKHTGRYGARGQKRTKRKKASPDDIKRQNQWKKERDLRRLIKWNFQKHDLWMTVTYKKGDRPTWEKMMKDIQGLLRAVRKKYKRQGQELKYVYRLQIGKRGGPHIHILVNRIQGENTDIIFSDAWKKGHINFRSLRESGGYRDLAEYIAKPIEEWEPENAKRYHTSRNLTRKEPREKVISRRSLIDNQGRMIPPKAPKGYYIDQESIRMGINPVTGFPYRHYTLVRYRRE